MSELALKLIAENKKTRSPFLNLSNCGLTEVPAEIGELVWLEKLFFTNKRFSFIHEMWAIGVSHNTGTVNTFSTLAPQTPLNRLYSIGGESKNNLFSKLDKLKSLVLCGDYGQQIPLSDR